MLAYLFLFEPNPYGISTKRFSGFMLVPSHLQLKILILRRMNLKFLRLVFACFFCDLSLLV